jgi:hypothetical protein
MRDPSGWRGVALGLACVAIGPVGDTIAVVLYENLEYGRD